MIRVLVATRQTQGWRSNDFCHALPGEIVYLGTTCDGATPDDRCGCARSFCGVDSGRATTTAVVAELALDREGVVALVAAARLAGGWTDDQSVAQASVGPLLGLVADEAVGTVFDIRGDAIRRRMSPGVPVVAAGQDRRGETSMMRELARITTAQSSVEKQEFLVVTEFAHFLELTVDPPRDRDNCIDLDESGAEALAVTIRNWVSSHGGGR
jgi:hypothetical protein